ncbi:MAG TPA: hypothetical protein VG226_01930 [Acidimicrobiales bacterium]|jgi:hypothetical protein|nr:hypothetical protein [Acidimicrobiales bacterium]
MAPLFLAGPAPTIVRSPGTFSDADRRRSGRYATGKLDPEVLD